MRFFLIFDTEKQKSYGNHESRCLYLRNIYFLLYFTVVDYNLVQMNWGRCFLQKYEDGYQNLLRSSLI